MFRTLYFEINPDGAKLVAYKDGPERFVLAEKDAPKW